MSTALLLVIVSKKPCDVTEYHDRVHLEFTG